MVRQSIEPFREEGAIRTDSAGHGRIHLSVSQRAACLKAHGGIYAAVSAGALDQFQPLSVSEALVLGLWNQGVTKYIAVFGHGSTDVAEVLAAYQAAGLIQTFNVRNEIEAAHCATMLRWHYGETAAVVTSIGPGALQALAGSLAAASNGIGVYHIYGDETTHDEGPNMQQIPRHEQSGFLALTKAMGSAYQVHTPQAIFTALRRGAETVFSPIFAGPFYLLMPMNVQPLRFEDCNLLEFPCRPQYPVVAVDDAAVFAQASLMAAEAERITIKFGGGADECGPEMIELADLIDAVIVGGAKMAGVVPYHHPRYMGVGGSKGTLSGNYALNHADLAIVIGARAVCQWDCSGTAWKNARSVINFNRDPHAVNHYNRSLLISGDAVMNLRRWIRHLKAAKPVAPQAESPWLKTNREHKARWDELKAERLQTPVLPDTTWGRPVLTQPAAIRTVLDFAALRAACCYFDAGDVQANGFQLAEDALPGRTFSETGASYMGFAVSALLAAAIADRPDYTFAVSGDGSFMMNPQILIDGIEHNLNGCVLILDNRAMAAITGLQYAQYDREFATRDSVGVDYLAMAASVRGVNALFGGFSTDELTRALQAAYDFRGLSVIHLPVYQGLDELGGLGAYGSWNVGNWCEQVQQEHHRLGL